MKIRKITNFLEEVAPLSLQESYDNSGLIVGDLDRECTGVITCLDSTEEIIDEAINQKANLVVAHHPIVFGGLKKLTPSTYAQRTVIKAIKYDIAIYAIHTNLDNVLNNGVNGRIADRLNLSNRQPIGEKNNLKKLVAFLPVVESENIHGALANFNLNKKLVGGYSPVFSNLGVSESRSNQKAAYMKVEIPFLHTDSKKIFGMIEDLRSMPNFSYEIMEFSGYNPAVGSGIIGELDKEISEVNFLKILKNKMNLKVVKHTKLLGKKIRKVAICGGSGGFLLKSAIRKGADIFITSDYKYHEFFDADSSTIIADIGHYESEQFTINLLYDLISEKFPNFAVQITEQVTNPVNYYY